MIILKVCKNVAVTKLSDVYNYFVESCKNKQKYNGDNDNQSSKLTSEETEENQNSQGPNESETSPPSPPNEISTSLINRISDYLKTLLELRKILRCTRSFERTVPLENRYGANRQRTLLATEVSGDFEPLARLLAAAQGDNANADLNNEEEHRQTVVVNVNFSNYLKFAIFLLAVNTLIFFKLLIWDHLTNIQLFF